MYIIIIFIYYLINFTLFDFVERLRDRGWLIPAYSLPKNCEDVIVARIVVREGFSHDMAEMLLEDMRRQLKYFASQPRHTPRRGSPSLAWRGGQSPPRHQGPTHGGATSQRPARLRVSGSPWR